MGDAISGAGEGKGLTPKKKRKASFDPSSYNKVVAAATLVDIQLIRSSFEVKAEYYRTLKDKRRDPDQNYFDFLFDGDEMASGYRPEDGLLYSQVDWNAFVRAGRKHLWKVKACYLIVYRGLNDFEEKYTMAFLKRTARFSSFPISVRLFQITIRLPRRIFQFCPSSKRGASY